jgi:hypothetical protein
MPVSDENLPLYTQLQTKRNALYSYTAKLRAARTIDNESYLNIEIGNAEWELKRLDAIMVDLNYNNPINFPSQAEFDQLRASVIALENATAQSAALSSLIAAGSAVIAAWPV